MTSRSATTWVATLSGNCATSDTITWDLITIKPNLGGTTATGNISLAFSTTSAADVADVGTITITHGAAVALNVTTEPSSITVAGVAFATQPIVTIEDQFGNTVTTGVDSTQIITAAQTGGFGSLSGTATEAAIAGVANFSGNGMSIELVGTDKVLTFSGDGNGSDDTSTSFTIIHAAAATLSVIGEPSSTTVAGVAFETQPLVTVVDAFGNTVTTGSDSTQTITAALTGGSGSLSGTATEAASNGMANFTGNGMSIDVAGTNKVLTFSGSGNGSNDTSASFTITAVVATPTPTPTPTTGPAPTPVPTLGPAPVPTAVPQNPLGEVPILPTPAPGVAAQTLVTPADGGTVTTEDGVVSLVILPGAIEGIYMGVQIVPIAITDAPPTPLTFKLGSTVIDIVFTDDQGVPLGNVILDRPVEVCIAYTDADADAAVGGASGLESGGASGLDILRFADPPDNWVVLNTTVDPVNKTLCAFTQRFSKFAVGISLAPAAEGATPTPTATETPVPTPTVALRTPVPSTDGHTDASGY